MRRAAWLLPLLLLTGGCAYYNGMYNAKRLAGQARKAERDGRTFEATSLWGQVAVKAESALVRHPDSKWADEARLLQGLARARLRDCETALPLLEEVMVRTRNREFEEQAALQVGSCRVQLGDPRGATSAYGRLTTSRDPARRSLALYAHGRALRIDGDFQTAYDELTGSADPRARGERAAALAGLGRVPEALALADSLFEARDSLAPWDSLAAGLARHDPAAARGLVTRLLADARMPVPLRAAVGLQDAARLEATDTLAAAARYEESLALAEGTPLGGEIRLQRAQRQVARAETGEALAELLAGLASLDADAGATSALLSRLADQIRRVLLAADSAPPGAPQGDLRLFMAGELARDSLGAPRFARRQFLRIPEGWPDSPFAPKAIMAATTLDATDRDSLLGLLAQRYPASPYVQFVQAGAAPGLQSLEDSLRRYAINFRPEGARRPAPRPTTPTPPSSSPREPVNR